MPEGLRGDVGVEAAGDGAVDDGLLLLVQQPNQLSLGADEAVDLPVRVVQKPHDGRLFVGRREGNDLTKVCFAIEILNPRSLFDRQDVDSGCVKREVQ